MSQPQAIADLQQSIAEMLEGHRDVFENPTRKAMIEEAVNNREAIVTKNGALATWTAPESTGRSPQDTYFVRRPESEANFDWEAPNNRPLPADTFDMVFEDAVKTLGEKRRLYVIDRVVGADSRYAVPVRVIAPKALTVLFGDNMFRPVPNDIDKSIFKDEGYTILVCPEDKLDHKKYENKLRYNPDLGHTSDLCVATDFDRRIGLVYGSNYCGSVKKLMFTVMNYVLPLKGVLSLHCSANEGNDGKTALLLGLSGTGKTTLSTDPNRALLGDDEHSWSEEGIANYENGCYAKLIDLNPKKEPEIYDAVFSEKPYTEHGAIIENAMVYPNGEFDLYDRRLTENSRGSYLLSALENIKPESVGGHPSTILFLTADANGVLPPIAKLNPEQAMLWFMMGYTSKLAGTETGVTEPKTAFSRFFGAPFMPLQPESYTKLLGEKMQQHGTNVFLVNTGWSGGPYGIGHRMDITLTRHLVNAALSGELDNVEYEEDKLFHVMVPKTCPGLDNASLLNPRNTWVDKNAYDERAKKLAKEFSDAFDKNYGNKGIDPNVVAACPGK